ncbi:hypothetical protein [Lederbergia lenta]|uniref:Putative lipoprotein n=1 Tax=Lederbergia lenta TaxID=1467 RepID=A0A2X4WLG2_LEDLE|nr:hypothetical protein [Lederbergia lenta]MEC2324104.1 hypothetical protein [Lederbergia lenta]SQI60608.1 putative lipoprotein [Lederbergia lenta]
MKKLVPLLSWTFILFVLLTGCGSNSDNTNGQVDQSDNPTTENNEQNEEDKNDHMKKSEETPNETDDAKGIRLMEKNLIYKGMNGKEIEETAHLTESDIQDYSMYVLPAYELTGEEPHKDVLYFTENDSHFMRIELLPSETNMDDAINTVKEQLSAVSKTVNEVNTNDKYDWLKNASAYESENAEEKVSAYLIKQDDWVLKLTIFTKLKEDLEDPFFKMAETIQAK